MMVQKAVYSVVYSLLCICMPVLVILIVELELRDGSLAASGRTPRLRSKSSDLVSDAYVSHELDVARRVFEILR